MAEKVGVTPATGFMVTSRKVMVIVEVDVPSAATGVVPVMVELAATAIPAVKITLSPLLKIGAVRLKVLLSAVLDFKLQVDSPLAFEALQVP